MPNKINKFFNTTSVIFLFFLFACSNKGKVEENSDNTLVAVVNGSDILAREVRTEIRFLISQFRVKNKNDLSYEEKLQLKLNGLNRTISNRLLITEANARNISVSREEYEEALLLVRSGYEGNSFYENMKIRGVTPKLWDKRFKNNLIIEKLIKKNHSGQMKVNDEQVRQYYDNHEKEFKKDQEIRARHIMVATEGEAQSLSKKIKSNKSGFPKLAKAYSLDPSGVTGGDLGYFSTGQMPEDFDSIFNLKLNQISEIIKTPYGYHIFIVIDKRPARQMSFDESKKRIYNNLLRDKQAKAFNRWLLKLKNKSKIKIVNNVSSKIKL
jgi:parvulin-like peptidyl-prolyl isomerase